MKTRIILVLTAALLMASCSGVWGPDGVNYKDATIGADGAIYDENGIQVYPPLEDGEVPWVVTG